MYRRWFTASLAVFWAALAGFAAAQTTPIPHPLPPNAQPLPGEIGGTRDAKEKGKKKKKKEDLPTISAEGRTAANDGKRLVVEVPDGRTLLLDIDSETQWTRSGAAIEASKIVPHTTVKVTAAVEDNYDLTVRQVELVKDAPAASPQLAIAKTASGGGDSSDSDDALLTGSNTALKTPDDPDRPVLKRNKVSKAGVAHVNTATAKDTSAPEENAAKSDDLDFTIDAASTMLPPRHSQGIALLNQTKDWADSYVENLPNFYCHQFTTRYARQNNSDDWHPQDVLTADVVYDDGHDEYRNITVDGKKSDKDMMHAGGSGQTSTGEFGGLLSSLFAPVRNTDFTYERTATMDNREVAIYGFKVSLGASDWGIFMGGQILHPAYSGRIWVDKKTGEIRRMEQHADDIPKDFPESLVETAVDYDRVFLGNSEYLVPVQAENIGCQRDTTTCARNVIEFRDYHRYKGEATLVF